MEETDDSLEDWRDLMLSPKGMFSGFMSDQSFMKSESDNVESDEVLMSNCDGNLGEEENGVGSMADMMMDNEESVEERRDVKFGLNASNNLSPRFKSTGASSSPASRPPCLNIPAGISPNALLDSPILLPNSQLSPTTGSLAFPPDDHDNQIFYSASFSADKEGDDFSSELKPSSAPISFSCYHPPQKQVHSNGNLTQSFKTEPHCESLVPYQPTTYSGFSAQQEDSTFKNMEFGSSADSKIPPVAAKSSAFQLSSHSYGVADNEVRNSTEPAQLVYANPLEGLQKGPYPSVGNLKNSDDGYNWRKYGQKQVKGSEYPRSYYKCTQSGCLVTKKVERSHDGEITEIIYKGAHSHPKPQPSRRSTYGSTIAYVEPTNIAEPVRVEMQQGYKDIKVGSEWRHDGLDRTSSVSVVNDVSDPHSGGQMPVAVLESAETPELSSTLASHDDEEDDTTTQGSLSVGEDDDVETESKRRKKENSLIEAALSSRALREPRVIVQIESEIDIIDDGYRWRKYGQKVVKGNPNPRSYYKCTSAGCMVRKHVERASHNLKYVLTTYEGKHNHPVPASRTSTHLNSNGPNPPPPSSISHSALTLPRTSHLPKPEPQDFIPPFDRKMEYGSEFLRPNYLGSLNGPSSSFYHMKFPTMPSNALCDAFGLPSLPPMIPSVRDLPIPLPLNFSLPSSFAMGGYGSSSRPLNPLPPFFMGQQTKESDMKFLRPKQEQGDESYAESSITSMDHNNAASPAPAYNNAAGGFSS